MHGGQDLTTPISSLNLDEDPFRVGNAFSMSDFPSLATPRRNLSTAFQSEEFVIQNEDFPALSPFGTAAVSGPGVSNANDVMLSGNGGRTASQASVIGTRNSLERTSFDMASVQSAFPALSVTGTSTPSMHVESNSTIRGGDRNSSYGLEGLLSVVKMEDKDLNMLALGMDLTSLGLNLNSTEPLHLTFASPWSEKPAPKVPQYKLPLCFYMQPPSLKSNNLSTFHVETLFYVFYAMPMDIFQAHAAQELYTREWKYHIELKLWFQRATTADGIGTLSPSSSQFVYFDVNSWERRIFKGSLHGGVHNVFLSEEDARVKFTTPAS